MNGFDLDSFYDQYVSYVDSFAVSTGLRPGIRGCAYTKKDIEDITNGLSFNSHRNGCYIYSSNGMRQSGVITTGINGVGSRDDFVTIRDMDRSAIFVKSLDQNTQQLNGHFVMHQITDDGYYEISFSELRKENAGKSIFDENYSYVDFVPNDILDGIASKCGLSPEQLKERLIAGYYYTDIDQYRIRKPITSVDVCEKDMLKLFNKVYKNGLPMVFNRMEAAFDISDVLEAERENSKRKELLAFTEGKDSITNLSELYVLLTRLKEAGVELTPEQQERVDTFEKLEIFRAKASQRENSQQGIRERNIAEAARKQDWWDNPANASNIHRREVEELLHDARRYTDVYGAIERNGMEDFMTAEQLDTLEKNREFERMMVEASKENGYTDSGMTPEIRAWYKDHYSNQENGERHK